MESVEMERNKVDSAICKSEVDKSEKLAKVVKVTKVATSGKLNNLVKLNI